MENTTDLNRLIEECIAAKASDLYILPQESRYKVSYETVTQLTTGSIIEEAAGKRLIAKLKYQANMAVSEHRRPQVGSLKWNGKSAVVNIRLSSVGDFEGRESLVLRFIYPLADINGKLLVPDQWQTLKKLVARRGLVIFAGPTGSGKTTTMYQLAKAVCSKQMVMTIEDPVEINETDFLQLQVNMNAQMDYEELIKVGLRHRPDVFIIGEIRDSQTAKMAIRAALSGHLVLSTVHAQSARQVLPRLEQLGIERFYLDQALTGISYQRLLPTTKDELAVLHEILDQRSVMRELNCDSKSDLRMTMEWRNDLEECVKAGKITDRTAEKYKNG